MPCNLPVAQCLAWHIKPNLAQARLLNGSLQLRGRCPACGARDTLSISAGEHQRIIWQCYSRSCDGSDVRTALLKAGVPSDCLPRSKGEDRSLAELADSALRTGGRNRGRTLLRAHLILRGYKRWPGGAELEKLAGEVGVGRAEAFAARKAGPLVCPPPCTSSTDHIALGVVKQPRSDRVSATADCPAHQTSPVHRTGESPAHRTDFANSAPRRTA